MKDISEFLEAWEMWYSYKMQTLQFLQAFMFLKNNVNQNQCVNIHIRASKHPLPQAANCIVYYDD